MWDEKSLKNILDEQFKDYSFVIVANREPYLHTYDKNGNIKSEKSIGGVSIIFDSIMKKTKGTWVAYGGSMADKVTADENGHIMVPPGKDASYLLRRVWMTDTERQAYYEGFSNETLWPLSHIAFIRPKFSEKDWQVYKKINKRFAEAVLEEIKGKKALVWVQDYQLSLVGHYIKKKRPDAIVGHFWHIPWPTHEIFRICPWGKEILEKMLSYDLLGFHSNYHVDNFLSNVANELEAKVNFDDRIITHNGKTIYVNAFPISIDHKEITDYLAGCKNISEITKKFIPKPPKILALGVDRMDYTKGIPNRLLAIERFFEKNPEYIGNLSYLGIAAPSRSNIKSYQDLSKNVKEIADRINQKYKTKNWQPIYLHNQIVRREDIFKLYNISDLCLVTPLDDGMNLVCKEYVAANKGSGALILSSFVGAAKELTESFFVNPYDIEGMADNIKLAIETSTEEKTLRMQSLKKKVVERNVFRWAGKYLLKLIEATNHKLLAKK